MKARAGRVLPGALVLLALLPGAAMALEIGSPVEGLFPCAMTNLAIAGAIVFLGVFSLYAYASLARLAPYHAWIYLYLVSLTGIAWAVFLASTGFALQDVLFILITVTGLNLIVHVLRLDRVEISSSSRAETVGVQPG